MNILALFPGQGSQSVGMGSDLYEQSPMARDFFALADETLGFKLSDICFNGPAERLMSTEITQPAILTVSAICYEIYRSSGRPLPTCAAGHSLGEYTSLVAAGSIDFADAVRLVNKRGKYMQEAVPVGHGKMVVVLGKELSEIEAALAQVTNGVAEAANINAPGQIVVGGDIAGVDQFLEILNSTKTKELPVSAPFHTSLMKPAQEKLQIELSTLNIKPANFPIFQNYTAQPTTDPLAIRANLEKQVSGKVRWVECMQHAISTHNPAIAIEFGAGNTLTGILKRIDSSVKRHNASSIESISQEY